MLAPINPISTGHVPLDIDVYPMDSVGTKKKKYRALTKVTMDTHRLRPIWESRAGRLEWSCEKGAGTDMGKGNSITRWRG